MEGHEPLDAMLQIQNTCLLLHNNSCNKYQLDSILTPKPPLDFHIYISYLLLRTYQNTSVHCAQIEENINK